MRKTLVAGATALVLVGAIGGVAVAADQDQDQVRDRDQTCSQDCGGDQTRSMLRLRDDSPAIQGDREMAQEQHRHHYRYESEMAPDAGSGHQGFGSVHRGPGPGGPGNCDSGPGND